MKILYIVVVMNLAMKQIFIPMNGITLRRLLSIKQDLFFILMMYLKDILEYKKLVKEFLNVATQNSHQFQNQNFLDRRGRHRNYSIVKTVDRELDTLTREFINGQIDHMGVLKKIDDIRGMLLDIMM